MLRSPSMRNQILALSIVCAFAAPTAAQTAPAAGDEPELGQLLDDVHALAASSSKLRSRFEGMAFVAYLRALVGDAKASRAAFDALEAELEKLPAGKRPEAEVYVAEYAAKVDPARGLRLAEAIFRQAFVEPAKDTGRPLLDDSPMDFLHIPEIFVSVGEYRRALEACELLEKAPLEEGMKMYLYERLGVSLRAAKQAEPLEVIRSKIRKGIGPRRDEVYEADRVRALAAVDLPDEAASTYETKVAGETSLRYYATPYYFVPICEAFLRLGKKQRALELMNTHRTKWRHPADSTVVYFYARAENFAGLEKALEGIGPSERCRGLRAAALDAHRTGNVERRDRLLEAAARVLAEIPEKQAEMLHIQGAILDAVLRRTDAARKFTASLAGNNREMFKIMLVTALVDRANPGVRSPDGTISEFVGSR
jgi:hypothetical protein